MNPPTQSKNTTILPVLIALTLGCFALSPVARAVCREGCDNSDTFLGEGALSNTTLPGNSNTAIGAQALFDNTTGGLNTAIGQGALFDNNTGSNNTATGAGALFANQGDNNTANGEGALNENTTGHDNTASGFHALFRNHVGHKNTATGAGALEGTINGITGFRNTATGTDTLFVNTTGFENTATGSGALHDNTSGFRNTAAGTDALFNNTTGLANTAIGHDALYDNTTGIGNTATGFGALSNNSGSNNIALGNGAGLNLTTGDNNIDIGHQGNAGEANTIRIGTQGTQTRTFIAGINGTALRFGVPVHIGTQGTQTGELGTIPSSARFKQNIKPMDKASEAVLALKPVTFHYKKELDPDGIPQFGLVAEEVEKVNPDLVVRDADGKAYTVCYEAVNVMLLNEFLKEHKKVEKLESVVASLAATVKEQATQIQKVSAQLEASKPAPQVVNNP
jgi:hypothetical protein